MVGDFGSLELSELQSCIRTGKDKVADDRVRGSERGIDLRDCNTKLETKGVRRL